MTSTPVSMNNESLNGSWIDITATMSPPNPVGREESSLEFLNYPQPLASATREHHPVQQNIGLISFQVERFLQEAARQGGATQSAGHNNNNNNNLTSNAPAPRKPLPTEPPTCVDDNNSGIYATSEGSDVSLENLGTKAILETLKQQQKQQQQQQHTSMRHQPIDNANKPSTTNFYHHQQHHQLDLSKSQESFGDFQLSDSLSFISRLSGLEVDYAGGGPCFGCTDGGGPESTGHPLDWLWDWSWQPEFFSGQEWKLCTPKQDYLMRQRQLYSANNHQHRHHHHHHPGADLSSSDMISLLFITNILSIIIGAGITYSILMRKSNS